jgi:hypothetical protein
MIAKARPLSAGLFLGFVLNPPAIDTVALEFPYQAVSWFDDELNSRRKCCSQLCQMHNHRLFLLLSKTKCGILPVGNQMGDAKEKKDFPQGTPALMVLKTLEVLGPLHGYGIARRGESSDSLSGAVEARVRAIASRET